MPTLDAFAAKFQSHWLKYLSQSSTKPMKKSPNPGRVPQPKDINIRLQGKGVAFEAVWNAEVMHNLQERPKFHPYVTPQLLPFPPYVYLLWLAIYLMIPSESHQTDIAPPVDPNSLSKTLHLERLQ
jgi:hypothetical protein